MPGELDLPGLDISMLTSVTTPEDPAWFPFQPVLPSMANIPEMEQCGRCEKLLRSVSPLSASTPCTATDGPRRLNEVAAHQDTMEESQRRNGVLLGMLVGAVTGLAEKLDSLAGANA